MLKAPAWCPHAVPTLQGWTDPNTGEVLKSANHSHAQIAEWHGHVPAPAPKPQTLHEAPSVERELSESEITHHYGEEE